MLPALTSFALHWALNALSLWLAGRVVRGVTFAGPGSLWVAALLLGIVNSVVRPVFLLLTLPLTLLTFGLFLPVLNALMLLLVAALVPGFRVTGFWSAFFAALLLALFNFALGLLVPDGGPGIQPTGNGVLI